jgi:hypothetical protein
VSATASAIDKIIEQKKLDGQIAGLDFFTKEERKEVLVELAELYMEDRAGHELRRNELQPWFGCTKGAIDDDVKASFGSTLELRTGQPS